MEIHTPMKMKGESKNRISKLLVVADASSEAWLFIWDAVRMLRKDDLHSVRVIFVSFLSETLKVNLRPNVLSLLLEDERETLGKTKEYFDRINIPYELKVIIAPPWSTVLREIRDGDQDLLMLQGEILNSWREYAVRGCPYPEMMGRQKYSILTIS